MSHIRVVVVDDEPLAREGIASMLEMDPDLDVVGRFSDGATAVSGITSLRPDLLFLDVQMPELNGFEVLSLIEAEHLPAVVFVTAFDSFAIKAFEVNAVDYLLKPVTEDRLAAAVARAKESIRRHVQAATTKHLEDFLRVFGVTRAVMHAGGTSTDPELPIDRLAIRDGARVRFVPTGEIDWIEGADYYSKVHAGALSLMMRESLTSLESRLDRAAFFRIHRSAIVALDRVRELRTDGRSDSFVVLSTGARLKVSRSRRAELERRLKTSVIKL